MSWKKRNRAILLVKLKERKRKMDSEYYNSREDKPSRNNNDDKKVIEFCLSENAEAIGIKRIAKERNTVVVEIKVASGDPLIIRTAINFRNWNSFIELIKTNISRDLEEEVQKKQLNRIIAQVETILNKNWQEIINSSGYTNKSQKEQDQQTGELGNVDKHNNISSVDDSTSNVIPFLTINNLIKKQSGRFTTKGTVVSITQVMQAISKIEWKCPTEYANGDEEPDSHNQYNKKIFDPPLLRLDGLRLRCNSCLVPAPDVVEPTVRKEWQNYIIIQLQDDGLPLHNDDLQKMTTIVYEQDIDKIHVGESIKVYGNIRVPIKSYEKPYSGKTINSNLTSALYAEAVDCERREEIKITEQDKQAFQKFVKYPYLMRRLGAMFAPNVIGHEDKKIAVLLASAAAAEGAREISNEMNRRDRIHILFVGPPGTAKTTLSYEAVNLLPNSRFTAAQTSSVKTILAIVEVQGDTKIIRYGAIPLAKNAICVIDEIGAMSYEDQIALFNVMEHGEFPLNKQGESKMISATTTIIGTSNPKNADASWINSAKVSKGEIPLRRALIDRFDIVLIFRDQDTEESAKEYANKKMTLSKKRLHNHEFLRKLLYYIKNTVTEVTFTKEAQVMLATYYSTLKAAKSLGMTNRALETLVRICKAWARLHLKSVVDAEIVIEVQKYFSGIILQYGEVIKASADPREIATEETVNLIKQAKSAIFFEEAAKSASLQSQQVKDYIGPNFKLRDNNRLREVSERVREHSNIKTVALKPLKLEWISDKNNATTTKNPDAVGNADTGTSNNHGDSLRGEQIASSEF